MVLDSLVIRVAHWFNFWLLIVVNLCSSLGKDQYSIDVNFPGIGKLETAVIEERVPSCQAELKASGCESTDESSRDDKYHFNTPPTISTESEIQACGITPVHSKGGRDAIKEDETEEDEEPSSDYKLPEASSGMEKVVRQMALDSGTDDQASSGTFSQDDMSPRFADLPQQLAPSPQLGRTTSAPITANDSTTENIFREVKSAKADRTLSMETRTTSIASDASEQEIPPSSPRISPTPDAASSAAKFVYGETIEKSVTDSVDIMTQSIYIGSEDCDSEISSESHQSVVSQTTQRKVSSTEDSNMKTTVKEEYVVSEAVVKLSENVTENILEETKSITKKAEVVSKEETKIDSEKSKETTIEKFVETRQEAKMSYSEVVKADTSKSTSVAKEAVAEVLKTEPVLQLVDSKEETNGKKMSYSEVLKSEKSKDDPIADWGKPLGLPSPNRPATPAAKQAKKTDEEPIDTNKVARKSHRSHLFCFRRKMRLNLFGWILPMCRTTDRATMQTQSSSNVCAPVTMFSAVLSPAGMCSTPSWKPRKPGKTKSKVGLSSQQLKVQSC